MKIQCSGCGQLFELRDMVEVARQRGDTMYFDKFYYCHPRDTGGGCYQKGKANKMPNPILEHFTYAHLGTQYMKDVSKMFYDLAWALEDQLDDGPEKSVALRKLLEAKDAAVRQARLSARNNEDYKPDLAGMKAEVDRLTKRLVDIRGLLNNYANTGVTK